MRAAAFALALVAAGCAVEPVTPDAPRALDDVEIAPYEVREECAQLAAGDRIDWRFEAKAPVTFNLYYLEGGAFLAPISRDDTTADAGVFLARDARRFCLRWEAGRQGAVLTYRIRVLPAGGAR
ncbi:MAG: hypothetical protein U1F10_14695 [Burkholderiales bacterium]